MTEPALQRKQKPARTISLGGVTYTETGTTYGNLFWHLRQVVLHSYTNQQLNREVLVDHGSGAVYHRSTGARLS